MGDINDNDRLIIWGLVAALILLILSFLASALVASIHGATVQSTAGAGAAGAAFLAVIGVLSLYLKRDQDDEG